METPSLEDLINVLNLGDIGDDVKGFMDALDPNDDPEDAIEAFLDQDAVGAILNKKLGAAVTKEDRRELGKTIQGRFDGLTNLFGGLTARLAHATKLRANAAVTLYATDSGDQLTANTTYDLRPRKNGTKASKDFVFEEDMIFFRAIIDPVDCAIRANLVGASVGFANEKARPFDDDVALTMFRPEFGPEETPLASLHKRSPRSDTEFQAQIRTDSDDLAFFYGLTLLYWDGECSKNFAAKWSAALGTADFKDYSKKFIKAVQKKVGRTRR